MFKNSFKEFFRNLPYIFIPMGIIYLFIIAFVFSFISSSTSDVITLVNHVSKYTGEAVNINQDAIINYLQEALKSVNFDGDFIDVARQLLNGNFLMNILDGLLNVVFVGYENYSSEVSGALFQTISSIKGNLITGGVFLSLSLPLSYVLTSYLIKRNSVKKNLKQKLISYLFEPLLILLTAIVAFVLFVLWRPSIFIALFVFLIFSNYINLFEAYYLRKDKKTKFGDIVSIKNSILMTLSNVFIAAIALLLVYLILLLTTPIIGILLVLPVAIYLFIIIQINAESYVKERVGN